MTNDIAVSVIMAVHNGARYLSDTLESLRRQTIVDFEVIIVDDASTDQTREILASFAERDGRVRLIANDRNLGLAASLNRGIEAARAPLLARLDADDIALPDRLAEQVRCFDADPALVLLGSNVTYIDADGRPLYESDLPLEDWTIRCWSLLQNPFAHPTVMMRRAPFERLGLRYDPRFETTQDWELWTRLVDTGRARNLSRPLVKQRVHSGSISARKRAAQLAYSLAIQERYVGTFIGRDAWVRADFELINQAFLADRAGADRRNLDRVHACFLALRLLTAVSAKYPARSHRAFARRVVRRAIQVGLVPPMRQGWSRLAFHLMFNYPAQSVSSAIDMTRTNLRRRA